MNAAEILRQAFAMPLESPSYPPGPYRFYDREYLIISYRTDPEALRAVVPEPLQVTDAVVKYEFIRMPNSTGFGDYTESGQVIPVSLNGVRGGYTHSMYLDCDPPIAGGRELWGFPKKLGSPTLRPELDSLVGTLDMGQVRVATGSMGFKHTALPAEGVLKSLAEPTWLLKILPCVDGTPRVCELVRYHLVDIVLKGAWTGPAALDLAPHPLAPVAGLPVLEVLSATHILADITLALGEVELDYLTP